MSQGNQFIYGFVLLEEFLNLQLRFSFSLKHIICCFLFLGVVVSFAMYVGTIGGLITHDRCRQHLKEFDGNENQATRSNVIFVINDSFLQHYLIVSYFFFGVRLHAKSISLIETFTLFFVFFFYLILISTILLICCYADDSSLNLIGE